MSIPARAILVLAAVAVAVLLTAPLVGPHPVGLDALFAPGDGGTGSVIVWQIRVPRVAAAFLAGLGLAVAGAAFQAVFRTPLATPYTLGVASGATLGVAVAMRLGLGVAALGLASGSVGALAGAVAAVAVVWILARMAPAFSATVLLLAGVAMNFFFGSLTLFLQYAATLGDSFRLVRWMMGGLGGVDAAAALQLLPFVVLGVALVVLCGRELDLLAVGEELAASRGVAVRRTRQLVFAGSSVMVGGIVAVCGPIGFVGMMAPHICRLLIGAEHRWLLPASALFGGAFLVVCDTVARTVLAPAELPVGVLTAFLGGPFFLWLLLKRGALRGLG